MPVKNTEVALPFPRPTLITPFSWTSAYVISFALCMCIQSPELPLVPLCYTTAWTPQHCPEAYLVSLVLTTQGRPKASLGIFPRSQARPTVSPLCWVRPLLPRANLSLNYAPMQHFLSVGPGLSKALRTLNFFMTSVCSISQDHCGGSCEPAAECCLVPGSEKGSLSHPALH